VSGASVFDDDARGRQKKLENTSEHKHKRPKRRGRENSPVRTQDKPDDPHDETVIPDDSRSDLGHPGCERNGGGGDTNAPSLRERARRP
jgi:hypothetical protein